MSLEVCKRKPIRVVILCLTGEMPRPAIPAPDWLSHISATLRQFYVALEIIFLHFLNFLFSLPFRRPPEIILYGGVQ